MDKCLTLNKWHTPATDYPEEQVGNYRIKRVYYRGHYYMYGIDGHLLFEAAKRIPVTCLQEKRNGKWHSWMVDDPPHERAMEIYAEQSQGHVLCAGLGLGLVLHALVENDKVDSITCVEISTDVINLMCENIPHHHKLMIVQADFFDYIRKSSIAWDGIIVDLWVANEKTKAGIYYHEVLPFAAELKLKYPNTSTTFHGFSTISDIKHTSPEMTKEVVDMMAVLKEVQ